MAFRKSRNSADTSSLVGGGGAGTDNTIARWDGTTAIQDSGVIIDDSDNITGITSLDIAGVGTSNAINFGSGVGTARIHSETGNRLNLEGATSVYCMAGGVNAFQLTSALMDVGSGVSLQLQGAGERLNYGSTAYSMYRTGTTLRRDSVGGFVELVNGVWTTRTTSTYFSAQTVGTVDLGTSGFPWGDAYINGTITLPDMNISTDGTDAIFESTLTSAGVDEKGFKFLWNVAKDIGGGVGEIDDEAAAQRWYYTDSLAAEHEIASLYPGHVASHSSTNMPAFLINMDGLNAGRIGFVDSESSQTFTGIEKVGSSMRGYLSGAQAFSTITGGLQVTYLLDFGATTVDGRIDLRRASASNSNLLTIQKRSAGYVSPATQKLVQFTDYESSVAYPVFSVWTRQGADTNGGCGLEAQQPFTFDDSAWTRGDTLIRYNASNVLTFEVDGTANMFDISASKVEADSRNVLTYSLMMRAG